MSEDEDKVWRIKDFDGFCKQTLKICCAQLGMEKPEYDKYITIENVQQIVKSCAEIEDEDLYLTEEIFEKITEEIQNWVMGVQLSKMCSKGDLDCYWDSDKNCMVFKVADKEEEGD